MATVGHAYLKIMPSLQALGRHLRDQIGEAERGAPAVSLTAQIQTALLREQLRAAAREGDQTAVRLLAELDALPAQTRFQTLLRQLSGHTVTIGVTAGRSLGAAVRGLGQVNDSVNSATVSFARMTGTVGAAVLKYGALAAAAGTAVGALHSIGAAAVTASGSLLLIPAAGLAAGTAIGTLKLGLHGVSETLKETDPKKFAESLAKLSPAARETALAVRAVTPEFVALRQAVQQELFAGLAGEVTALSQQYLPVLRTGLVGMAGELRRAAGEGIGFARSMQTSRDLGTIMGNSQKAVGQLGRAFAPLLQVLRDIAVVGSGFLPTWAGVAGDAAQRFAVFIAHARQTGQLHQWISSGLSALGELFSLLGNVLRIIGTVFSAANTSGVGLLSTLNQLTGSLLAWMRSAEGTRALQQIFGALHAAAVGLGPVFREIGKAVTTSIAPALAALGPMVGDAFRALAPAVAPLGKIIADLAPLLGIAAQAFVAMLVPAVQALQPVVAALAPVLGQVAGSLGGAIGGAIRTVSPMITGLATALAPLITGLGGLLVEAINAAGPALARLGAGLTPIISAVGGALLDALSAVLPVLGELAGVFTDVLLAALQAVMPVLPPLVAVIRQVAAVISGALSAASPVLVKIGQLLGQILTQAITALAPLIPPLAQAFTSIVGAVLPLIAPLLQLVSSLLPPLSALFGALVAPLTQLGQTISDGLGSGVPVLTQAAELIGQTLSMALEALMPLIPPVAGAIQAVVGAVAALIAPLLQLVSSLLPPLSELLGAVVPPFVEVASTIAGVVEAVAPLVQQLAQYLIPIINDLLAVVGPVFSAIGEIIGGALRAIKGVIDVVLGVISGDWRRVWTGIKDFFGGILGGIVSGVGKGLGAILDFFASLPGKIWGAVADAGRWLLNVGWNIVMGLIDGLANGWNKVVDWLKRKVGELVDSVLAFFGISSPSKVFMDIGGHLSAGLAVGIEHTAAIPIGAATALAASVTRSAAVGAPAVDLPAMGGVGAAGAGGSGMDPIVLAQALTQAVQDALHGARMTIDGSGVARLVNQVNALNARR